MRVVCAVFAFAVALLAALPAAAQSWPAIAAVPVHGNWCGPGYGNGLPPTDPLDAACMRHDICTARVGSFSCGCDIALMSELRATPWPNPGIRAKARAIYDAIAATPCRGAEGQAVKMSMAFDDWAREVAAGREAPWDFLRRWGLLGLDGLNGRRWRGW